MISICALHVVDRQNLMIDITVNLYFLGPLGPLVVALYVSLSVTLLNFTT